MKKVAAFVMAFALAAGCMTMPVLAGELPEHDHAAGVEAHYDMYSPYCPVSGCNKIGTYQYQVESVGGHWMVYMKCPDHGLYHYFI